MQIINYNFLANNEIDDEYDCQDLTDNELLYSYYECYNVEAYELLKRRYIEKIINISFKFSNYSSISTYYTVDDIASLINEFFDEGCSLYNYRDNPVKFCWFIITFIKNRSLDEFRKFTRKGHVILNKYSTCYELWYLNNISDDKTYSSYDDISEKEELYKKRVEWISNFLDSHYKEYKEMFFDWLRSLDKQDFIQKYKITNYSYIRRKLCYIRERLIKHSSKLFNSNNMNFKSLCNY